MSQGSEKKLVTPEDLSCLMDGELDAYAVAGACGHWREDADARAQWHAYHLIGDVLRSEDLACDSTRDAAFLASLRKRLADEPVVLAPASHVPSSPARARPSWLAPAAVAAGFVVVAGALVVTQMAGGLSLQGAHEPAVVAVAEPPAAASTVAVADAASSTGDLPAVVWDDRVVRDARLDEYLAAHKKFGGSSVLGGPSGFLRKAAVDNTAR